MQTGPSKRKQRALTRSFVVTVAVGLPAALAVGIGCGASTPDNNNNAGPGTGPVVPGVQNGKCTNEGEQRPCHFSMGKTAGGAVQTCFSGTQTCTAGLWGSCGGDGTISNTASLPGLNVAPAGVGATGIHTQAIGPLAVCGDGICAPLICLGPGGGDLGKTCTVPGVGTCSGGKTCGAGESFATCALDCKTPPGADAGVTICTSDPCNPDCQGWVSATPITSTAGAATNVIGVSGFGQIPNGQLNKLLLEPCDNFAAAGLPSSYYNCQVDTYCQMAALGGDSKCHQFPAAGVIGTDPKGMGTTVVGMDVTMGPGCSNNESDGYRYFPICNRGTVAIPAGTVIRVKYMNPVQPFSPCATCTTVAGPNQWDCSMLVGDAVVKAGGTTPGPLLPGTCQLLDTQQVGKGFGGANCAQPNGEKWMFANCDGAVVEGNVTMNPAVATPMPANEPTTIPGIAGCANNWSDHSGSNNPPACGLAGQNVITFANDYHAVCPVGTNPVWSKLNYDTTSASNGSGTAEVFFEAATAKDVAGVPGVYSPYYQLAEATDDASGAFKKDPEKCSTTKPFAPPYAWPTCTNDPAPAKFSPCCPKDIEDQFTRLTTNLPFPGAGPPVDPLQPIPGPALARQEWLRLQITVKATPDNKKDVTLNSWSLSYQCIATE